MARPPVGKICVYCCDRQATTWDHVFAKGFLPKDRRDNIPQVPACKRCNNDKSKLENELAPLLPFGGRHVDASRHLTTAVPKMLAENRRLHRKLQEGASHQWVINDAGSFDLTLSVPVSDEMLAQLFALIARGLAWKEWGVQFDSDCTVRAFILTPTIGEMFFNGLMTMGATQRAKGNVGNGALVYEGTRSRENPTLSAWTFRIYGGVNFASADLAEGLASKVGVLTGRSEFIQRIWNRLDTA